MPSVSLAHEVDFAGWREAARTLALTAVPPENVVWSVGNPDDLFAGAAAETATPQAGSFTVPRPLVDLAQTVIQAREPERFSLLYGLIWRAHRGEKHLMAQVTDPAVHRASRLAQSIRRDTHKMRAFVRFREVQEPEGTRHVAFFEPDHFIVEANAGFFVRRFATMRFSILTPYRSLHWTGQATEFGPGASLADVPDDDALECYWRAYFSSIFNPARLKVAAMRSEMPKKYWRNLPEAAAIPDLIRSAGERTDAMVDQPVAPRTRVETRRPQSASRPEATGALAVLAREAADCRRCPLWEPATQTVFGEGPETARMMMVGEQPGDQEDLVGRPFVGPAGQILDRAIKEAGIDRREVYVTNAVKHFKFEQRGKRRIHSKPDTADIVACAPWLEAERQAIKPAVTVLLGATAARAVLGRAVTISRERGRPIAHVGNSQVFVTVHPSYLLRLPDEESKRREYAAFVTDLRHANSLL